MTSRDPLRAIQIDISETFPKIFNSFGEKISSFGFDPEDEDIVFRDMEWMCGKSDLPHMEWMCGKSDLPQSIDDDRENVIRIHERLHDLCVMKIKRENPDVRRGDIVHFEHIGGYRNSGKVIYDGQRLIPLAYEPNDHGCPPQGFDSVTEFPIEYWSIAIDHNLYVRFDHHKFLDQIIDNLVIDDVQSGFTQVDEAGYEREITWSSFTYGEEQLSELCKSHVLYNDIINIVKEYIVEEFYIIFETPWEWDDHHFILGKNDQELYEFKKEEISQLLKETKSYELHFENCSHKDDLEEKYFENILTLPM